tara:strand:+ start:5292 stop:6506 length:1215 start_codon:yes stop_codon:yes gene_type:complete
MKKIIIIFSFFVIISCTKENTKSLENTYYRVFLEVLDNEELPFIINVTSKNSLEIYNAEEVILVDEITYKNDSVFIQVPVFEGYIAAKITDTGFEGDFIIESYDRIVPVKGEKNNKNRFPIIDKQETSNIDGVWQAIFNKDSEEESYVSKGTFKQSGNRITGTFRTPTGDYRYLEGSIYGNKFQLSTFDGAHAFLFTGSIVNDSLSGIFYSGKHWKEPFEAKRNPTYELPSSNDVTFLKEGYDKFEFSFPDENGNLVSLEDKRFKNKVTIVQIMGSWCPNCLDESKYYTQYLKENPNTDVQFISLAFEISKTPELAFKRINRLKERIGIKYPIILAQYGSDDKLLANEKLPMLSHILSFPTSLYIDKKGTVRKIHTGFNGPATGQKYLDYKKEFEDFINILLKE